MPIYMMSTFSRLQYYYYYLRYLTRSFTSRNTFVHNDLNRSPIWFSILCSQPGGLNGAAFRCRTPVVRPPAVDQRMWHGRGSRSAVKWHWARGADTACCLRRPQDGVRHGDGAMRRPPSPIPSTTDRAPPEPRATPSARGRFQRTVAWPVRRRRDGRDRGIDAARPTRQPAEYRLRDQEATAQRKKVCRIFFSQKQSSFYHRINV